jgi:uncharacterized protein (DUF433 family)
MSENTPRHWIYLAPDPKSPRYRQLFVKGRRIAARTLFGMYASQEEPPMTVEQIAADYDLPVAAVLEAIAYCQSNPPEIQQDWQADERRAQAADSNTSNPTQHPIPSAPSTTQENAEFHRP